MKKTLRGTITTLAMTATMLAGAALVSGWLTVAARRRRLLDRLRPRPSSRDPAVS